jgi:IS1 family transposase
MKALLKTCTLLSLTMWPWAVNEAAITAGRVQQPVTTHYGFTEAHFLETIPLLYCSTLSRIVGHLYEYLHLLRLTNYTSQMAARIRNNNCSFGNKTFNKCKLHPFFPVFVLYLELPVMTDQWALYPSADQIFLQCFAFKFTTNFVEKKHLKLLVFVLLRSIITRINITKLDALASYNCI